MVVGVLQLDLLVPASHSLKDKRAVIRSLLAMVQHTCQASVAEVGHQDLRNRALLGFAVACSEGRIAERLLQQIEEKVAAEPEVEIVAVSQELIHL